MTLIINHRGGIILHIVSFEFASFERDYDRNNSRCSITTCRDARSRFTCADYYSDATEMTHDPFQHLSPISRNIPMSPRGLTMKENRDAHTHTPRAPHLHIYTCRALNSYLIYPLSSVKNKYEYSCNSNILINIFACSLLSRESISSAINQLKIQRKNRSSTLAHIPLNIQIPTAS